MDRFLLPLLGALIGAAGGVLAARALAPDHPVAPSAEVRGTDDLREQVAEIRRLLDRPALATVPSAPAPAPAAAAAGAPAAGTAPLAQDQLDALAARVADVMDQRRAAKEAAEKEAKAARHRRLPLAEAARELGLTAAQETEVRVAHEQAIDKFLKLVAEPESDGDTLRRELVAAKDDRAKKTAIVTRFLPKMMSKLGDVVAIETEREARIVAAVGEEKAARLRDYDLEEEDPFDLGNSLTVGFTAGD